MGSTVLQFGGNHGRRPFRPLIPVFGPLLALALGSTVRTADAGFGGPPVPVQEPTPATPAQRYGGLERDACEAELTARQVPFVRVGEARGVLAPVRLNGPIHGVTFHSTVAPSQRASTPYEIVDCRLALALDDFAVQLHAHDIVDVVHYSIYRPPSGQWPVDRVGSQHMGALAIDAASFTKSDGTRLDVEHDFHGRIGATTCGPGTGPEPTSAEALELHEIVCDAAQAKLFNVALTPDFNWAHRNHFHLEVTAGVSWFVIH